MSARTGFRSRSPAVRSSALAFAAALVVVPAAAIPLPSPAQRPDVLPNPTQLLGPDQPNEVINKAPGPIADAEHVHVGLGPTGAPVSVAVDQKLVLTGRGDFDLKIPGPALLVTAPANEPNQPRLRRESVVWA